MVEMLMNIHKKVLQISELFQPLFKVAVIQPTPNFVV